MKLKTILVFAALNVAALADPANQAAPASPTAPSTAKEDLGAKCLAQAKLLWAACNVYANDYRGNYPKALADVFPDYLGNASHFVSVLSPNKPIGFKYSGGKQSDPPKNVLLQSIDTTTDGLRVIVYIDGSGELVRDQK